MLDVESFRKAGYLAIDRICDYYTALQTQKDVVSSVEPGYLGKLVPKSAPVEGEDISLIADDFQQLIMPGITHWQHPKFFAYFPANANLVSILADIYASSVSNPGFGWTCSPACTELESIVMDWSTRLFGLADSFLYSGGGGGIIMGSASESALTAAIGARERALRILAAQDKKQHEQDSSVVPHGSQGIPGTSIPLHSREKWSQRLVMYGSTQTHSIGSKAALIMGHPFRAVPVSSEDGFSLRGDALRAVMEEDKAAGLVPFFVIGTVGTTSSGAVDNIAEIGQVLEDYPTAHLHIDAAWAGMGYACPEYRGVLRLDDVNKYAASYSSNFHKQGLVHFDCSALWVRDRKLLSEALDVTPEFLRTKQGDAGLVIDYRNLQLALGRKFRSLKLWFVLRSYGVSGFQAHIRKSVNLANRLSTLITSTTTTPSSKGPLFELVAPISLSLVVFRLHPPGVSDEIKLDKLNRELYDRINKRKDIMLTQTLLPGQLFCIRWAIGAESTRWEDVVGAWESVLEETRGLLKEEVGVVLANGKE